MLSMQKNEGSEVPGRAPESQMVMEGFKEELKLTLQKLSGDWICKKETHMPDKSKEVKKAMHVLGTVRGTACKYEEVLCTWREHCQLLSVTDEFLMSYGLKKQ